MKVWRAVTGGVAVLALSVLPACGGDDDDDDVQRREQQRHHHGDGRRGFGRVRGLPRPHGGRSGRHGRGEGRPWRVVSEDGEDLAVTMDFVEDRLNFAVEDGVVVEVTTG